MVTVWQFVDEWNLLAYHRVFCFVLGVSKSEERFDDVMTATKLLNLAGCGRINGASGHSLLQPTVLSVGSWKRHDGKC